MKQDKPAKTSASESEIGLEELENRVRARLCGSIRDFRLDRHEAGIVLRGIARTFHAKQLAQHAVMLETNLPILANEIEVG